MSHMSQDSACYNVIISFGVTLWGGNRSCCGICRLFCGRFFFINMSFSKATLQLASVRLSGLIGYLATSKKGADNNHEFLLCAFP